MKVVTSGAGAAAIFACANPTPEIFPDDAKAGGAKVIATGRSDFPNQINNVLAFPGIFRGAFDVRVLAASAVCTAFLCPENAGVCRKGYKKDIILCYTSDKE